MSTPDARGFFTRCHVILPHLSPNLMGDPFPGDPESRREIGCGLDEAACEFSGIGHGSIIWKLKARTMHARGHKISNNSPGCFLLVA